MFNVFVKVIPNFYSCKANVEFTVVCFDDINGFLSAWPSCLITSLSICLLIHLFFCLPVCVTFCFLSVCLSICLSGCRTVSQFYHGLTLAGQFVTPATLGRLSATFQRWSSGIVRVTSVSYDRLFIARRNHQPLKLKLTIYQPIYARWPRAETWHSDSKLLLPVASPACLVGLLRGPQSTFLGVQQSF